MHGEYLTEALPVGVQAESLASSWLTPSSPCAVCKGLGIHA